ncbi:MAG: AEC family transporter [Lachnospiraceae bacterium]|nr:AEC family transporter [Lachnospiraceae bacterium]
MNTVFIKAISFIAIILLGYALRRGRVLHKQDMGVFSALVTKITLPAAIIYNFGKASIEVSMLASVLIGFLCSGLFVVVGYLLFLHGSREERAFAVINMSGYNVGCFTMPFVQSFLGPLGVATASLFDAGNAMICTGTSYAIAVAISGKGEIRGPKQMIKRLFSSAPFDCYITMTLLALFHVRLPELVFSFTEVVGGANSFLALLMIGLGLELHITREQAKEAGLIIGTRLLISIGLALLFLNFGPFGREVNRTLAIFMFGPVSSLGVPYTSMINGDVALASAVNSMSILVGIVTLTAVILLLS